MECHVARARANKCNRQILSTMCKTNLIEERQINSQNRKRKPWITESAL